jgi:hypothetical protein
MLVTAPASGVPEMTPLAASKVAHAGRPVAVKVIGTWPLAVSA